MDGALTARIAEAERLASSGDYEMAETVLEEAARGAEKTGPAALDAVDRVRAQIEFRRGRYDEAMALFQGILSRAEQRRDLPTLAQAESDIASLWRRRSNLAEAIEGYERALALYRGLADRGGEALVLTQLGLIRLNQGEFSVALELLRKSQELQETGASAELDRTLHYLGLLYAGMREYDTALTFLQRGLVEARKTAEASREAPLLGSLARVSNFRREYAEALEFSTQAERLAERLDSPPSRAYSKLEHGRALLGLNRIEEARTVLEEGERIAAAIGQQGTRADYLGLLAEIAQRQGRSDEALQLWDTALPTYQQGHDQPQLLSTYRAMIPVLRDRGQLERAVEIGLKSLALQEHLTGLDMNRRLAVLESQHRQQEAARQIELLQRDLKIQALGLRQEELKRWIAVGAVVSLAMILGLLWMRYRESQQLGRRLESANQALLSSQSELSQAHAELRRKAEALARAASTDVLTGVANRRAFLEGFSQSWDEAVSDGGELSLVLIDIDDFKKVNDTLGHAVGDAALCALAECLQSQLRPDTPLARWGGEEFAVLVPANADAAATLSERLRAAVARMTRKDIPRLTVSIGVASLAGRRLARQEALFEEADGALYQAKAAGRDRVQVARGAGR
ncbi:MAG: diguanylate cyclase [Lysobacterales bacterium]|nr:diguanylate cyclase [Rhodanobacteraceae bacterium]